MVKALIEHPPYLKRGDMVGITCPAGYVSEDRASFAIETLKLWGFDVKVGTTVGSENNYFSGTDEQRLSDLQDMLDDPSVKAILMGRGGYGTSRIIDQLDWSKFNLNPKWICGFSDITVLHSHLHATMQMPSMHSPMTAAFRPDSINMGHIQQYYAALTGVSLHYHAAPSDLNRIGTAKGILVGGNLAILAHLVGSKSDIDTTEKILFIEDIGEHLYKVDRMLLTLKRGGKLDKLRGLIVGGFTEMEDTERPFGKTVEEIISEMVQEYNYPVCFNLPVGHIEENHTLIMGMWHKLNVTEQGGSLEILRDITV